MRYLPSNWSYMPFQKRLMNINEIFTKQLILYVVLSSVILSLLYTCWYTIVLPTDENRQYSSPPSEIMIKMRQMYNIHLILIDNTDKIIIDTAACLFGLVWFLVFNATFNNISVISWRSVLLVEETGVPGENHRPGASHCQPLSRAHNDVLSTPRLSGVRTHNVNGAASLYLFHV